MERPLPIKARKRDELTAKLVRADTVVKKCKKSSLFSCYGVKTDVVPVESKCMLCISSRSEADEDERQMKYHHTISTTHFLTKNKTSKNAITQSTSMMHPIANEAHAPLVL